MTETKTPERAQPEAITAVPVRHPGRWVAIVGLVIVVTLGIVIAMMRLSPNPILSGAAWLYTWFFRAVPRIVLLVLFGNLGILYTRYEFGIPFDRQIGNLLGVQFDGRFL